MLNNFIYAQTKDLFVQDLEAGNVMDEAIAFIEDTREIWNHGSYYATPFGGYAIVDHGTNDTAYSIAPNVLHVWGEVPALTISFSGQNEEVAGVYLFRFTSGGTATTLSLPDNVKWADVDVPTIEPNKVYQVSVINGLGRILRFNP